MLAKNLDIQNLYIDNRINSSNIINFPFFRFINCNEQRSNSSVIGNMRYIIIIIDESAFILVYGIMACGTALCYYLDRFDKGVILPQLPFFSSWLSFYLLWHEELIGPLLPPLPFILSPSQLFLLPLPIRGGL